LARFGVVRIVVRKAQISEVVRLMIRAILIDVSDLAVEILVRFSLQVVT